MTNTALSKAEYDRAIASGITLSVPRADGKRHDVPAKILEVSPPWGSLTPAQRAEWDDPRRSPQEDRK